MPFVVDWTPVTAMGSLATQTGQAVGRATGNAAFTARQDSVDARTAEINQRNRELGFAARQAPVDDARRAGLQAGLQDRQFAQQKELAGIRGEYGLEQAATRARPQRTPDQIEAEAYAREAGRTQARTESQRMQSEKQREEYVQRAINAGASEDEAQQAYDQLLQRGAEHKAGIPAQKPRSETYRPGGKMRSSAYGAARMGDFQGIAQAVGSVLSIDNPLQAQLEAADGIALALEDESVPLDQAQAAAADASLPPWIRSAISAAITRRGDTRFGVNQSRPSRDLSHVSDADLIRALQAPRR